MSNDMKKSIKNAMNKSKLNNEQASQEQTGLSENNTSSQEVSNYASEIQAEKMQDKKKRNNPLKRFGVICIALFIISLMFINTTSVDTSDAAKNALVDKVSTSLPAGTVLLSADENIAPQDYTIVHNYDKENTKIWIWDYAAEDGDYVQVFVNGTPIGDAFMIKHKPIEFTVPSVGEVQIKGIRDGGGGITYAVRYDLNGTIYFNTAPEGEFNTYTLVRE